MGSGPPLSSKKAVTVSYGIGLLYPSDRDEPLDAACLSDATVTLALVSEPVPLPAFPKLRLAERDRLGQGHSQVMQVRLLGEGQPVP